MTTYECEYDEETYYEEEVVEEEEIYEETEVINQPNTIPESAKGKNETSKAVAKTSPPRPAVPARSAASLAEQVAMLAAERLQRLSVDGVAPDIQATPVLKYTPVNQQPLPPPPRAKKVQPPAQLQNILQTSQITRQPPPMNRQSTPLECHPYQSYTPSKPALPLSLDEPHVNMRGNMHDKNPSDNGQRTSTTASSSSIGHESKQRYDTETFYSTHSHPLSTTSSTSMSKNENQPSVSHVPLIMVTKRISKDDPQYNVTEYQLGCSCSIM
jgi:hypothetical protein